MNTLKKLYIAIIGVLLLTLGINNAAYASEIVDAEDVEDTYLTVTEDLTEKEEDSNPDELEVIENENILDPELYEIFVDEQGQVYYIEKEPVEPENDESKEELDNQDAEDVKSKKNKKAENKPSYSEKDLRLLSCLVYAEAGNQSYEGMLAVANVVLNRVKSKAYSHVNTIEEVIYDNKWAVQFSVTIKRSGKSILDRALECYDSGKFPGSNPEGEKKSMERAIKAAKAALSGENNIGEYLCFRLNDKKASSIKKKYEYKIIDDHIFYRTK